MTYHLTSLLSQLGFSEKEAEIYLLLNKLGPTPASTLARLAGIQRTSIYDLLYKMEERNYIISYKQGATVFFSIDDLDKLVLIEKEKLKAATSALEQLKQEKHSGTIHLQYYRGIEGMRDMYESILEAEPEELLVWVNIDHFYSPFDESYDAEWTRKRVEKKIFTRLLMMETQKGKEFQAEDKKLFRETVLIPEEFMFASSCFLYGNHICLFDTHEHILGIDIDNQSLSLMQKKIFEMNWKLFKK